LSNAGKQMTRYTYLAIIFLILVLALANADAASWSGSVKTNSDTWSIVRESSNLSFTYMQSVEGQISPVDYRGRTLSPYHSFYEDAKVNDVRIKERTAALEASYSSEELLSIESSINNSVNLTIEKPAGTDLYTIDFYERWPVKLNSSKSIKPVVPPAVPPGAPPAHKEDEANKTA
jgi:hypothetical protein